MKAYRTAQHQEERLQEVDVLSTGEATATIHYNCDEKFQTILGFGGALTEASAFALSKLSEQERMAVLENYYHPTKGIGYNFSRTHIHSCDFALHNYTYVEEGDQTLDTFTLERDEKFVLPLVRDVLRLRKNDVTILASPWSPPAYMKTTGEMNNGGQLKPEYNQLWADYYVKYIQEMEKLGIHIWGVTVQNEPDATQVWDSCIYSAEEERDFVKNYLGPTFERAGLEEKKIIIWDHNRDIVWERAHTVLQDEEAAKYIWGTGIHWYMCEDFENTTKVHNAYPDKHLIFTEGCNEGGVKLGAWHTGERYGRNIIGDLNNYIEAWLDWNIVLDETGGPNHVNNLCDAPVIVDTKEGIVHYNSSFYYIAHFSKFMKPGARRIAVSTNVEGVYATGCENENGEVVLVMMNETDTDHTIELAGNEETHIVSLPAHAIITLVK